MKKDALIVCGEKKKEGITVWDLETSDVLFKIPSCSSPPQGLLCLNNHLLVASQLQTDRPFGCGSIFFWPLNKPQAPQISYPMEGIGPIVSSKDGIYLVGGTRSGNVYIWEVTSGRLLKNWHAHHRPLSSLAFSHDDSFLISSSEDGTISVWYMISLLNTEDSQASESLASFHYWSEHGCSVTGLLVVSSGSSPVLISSSLDGTCKVRDIISGTLLQNHVFSVAVTAIAVDPVEQLLFAGRKDGKIYVNVLDLGLQECQVTISEEESGVLYGHKGPVTALAFDFGGSLLISASEDCTVCLWDVTSWQVIRRFTHGKGHVTNLLVVPKSSLSGTDNRGNSLRRRIPSLEKASHQNANGDGTLTLLPRYFSHENNLFTKNSLSSQLLNKQNFDSEQMKTPEAIEMKIGSSIENRLWILNMTKHMNSVNQRLQSRIIDMVHSRLCGDHTVTTCMGGGTAKGNDFQDNQNPPA